MNQHGRHAREVMIETDPERYSQIQDPETYFHSLGNQIRDRIAALESSQTPWPEVDAEQDPMRKIGLLNAAKTRAREIVYQEMIYDEIPATTTDQ